MYVHILVLSRIIVSFEHLNVPDEGYSRNVPCALFDIYIFLKDWLVLNATFNNISVISWRSVLLVEDNLIPGENHQHATSH